MYELLKLFFDICLFKKGPQDVPVSNWLLRLLILVYVFISFLIIILSSNLIDTILQVLLGAMLILASTWIILYVAKRLHRFQQTACALIGTDTLFSFFALPAMATLIGQGTALAFIAIVILMLWHWVVSGHIFSQALEQPFSFGLGISFLYILTSYQVMAVLFPEVISVE